MKRKKNKNSIKDIYKYNFDKLMAKGTTWILGVLCIVVVVVAFIIGTITSLMEKNEPIGKLIWDSFTNMLDPGVISGADYLNAKYTIPMLIATLFGVFFTATLIGLITQAISTKIESLKDGESRILDENHFVIIGYNDRIFNIIYQFILSFEGTNKKHVIVVIGDFDKSDMEAEIRRHIKNNFLTHIDSANDMDQKCRKRRLKRIIKHTDIICRRGSAGDRVVLEKCNVKKARSIMINEFDDFLTMKSLLALGNISSQQKLSVRDPYIIAVAMKRENIELFKNRSETDWMRYIFYFNDQIAKITARSCLHPGISDAFTDLIDFGGSEIYIERPKDYETLFYSNVKNKIVRKEDVTFSSILNKVRRGIVIGYKRSGEIYLNPNQNDILYPQDKLVIFAEEQNKAFIAPEPKINVKNYDLELNDIGTKKENILIFGCNENLIEILANANDYVEEGSCAFLTCTYEQLLNGIKNMELEKYSLELHNLKFELLNIPINDACGEDYYNKLRRLFSEYIIYQCQENSYNVSPDDIRCKINIRFKLCDIYNTDTFKLSIMQANSFLENIDSKLEHILVLSDTELSDEEADEKTLFLLMNIRQNLDKNSGINVTSEMRKFKNQIIAKNASVDDFIISDELISNMLTQIAKNKDIYEIFDELLDADGSEVYMDKMNEYLSFENEEIQELNFFELTKIVTSQTNKIPIGYVIKNDNGEKEVKLNPLKHEIFKVRKDDSIIVISEEA